MLVSLLAGAMVMVAAGFALRILRHWDLASGSELQVRLERQTYLVSTLLVICFAGQLLALILFVMTAESMSGQFTGAMCATGVLNVNGFGWPVLFAKIAVFFASAAWLILNHVDSQAPDYPLIRAKYLVLLCLVPLVLLETVLLFLYFLGLDPDIITSCCGSLFSASGKGVAGELSAVSPRISLAVLILSAVCLPPAAMFSLRSRTGAFLYSLLAVTCLVVGLVSMVSLVALYIYEHPHHHCPFCILKSGYHYIGYVLYFLLFSATSLGIGPGILAPWRNVSSLGKIIARTGRRLALASLILYSLFYGLVAVIIYCSHLTMTGVWW